MCISYALLRSRKIRTGTHRQDLDPHLHFLVTEQKCHRPQFQYGIHTFVNYLQMPATFASVQEGTVTEFSVVLIT